MQIAILFIILLYLHPSTLSQITGTKETCDVEDQPITLNAPHMKCFNCTCKNSQVQCLRRQCPDLDCYVLENNDECCQRCKGCSGKDSQHYDSGISWMDSCEVYTCRAGVITRSKVHCYVPCDDPMPPKVGQCCPSCSGICKNNVRVFVDTLLKVNPCVVCECVEADSLVCTKSPCPVLNCPKSSVVYDFEQCCPRCEGSGRRTTPPRGACLLGTVVYPSGKRFVLDECTNCLCDNSTLTCERTNCPVLKCGRDEQKIGTGECCATCLDDTESDDTIPSANEEESHSGCVYDNKSYKDGETWDTSACETCVCKEGQVSCSPIMCPAVNCPVNSVLQISKGQCCPTCVERQGVCTIFGGSHFRTFDDKLYAFVGSCKYQLAGSSSFNVRVKFLTSGNDAKIKRVFAKISNVRVDLQYNKNVRVDDRVVKLPYKLMDKLEIVDTRDSVTVSSDIGLKIKWNYEGFLELTIPQSFNNNIAGLCGNFNSQTDDDLTTREGILVESPAVFAQSWTVGDEECYDTREYEVRACDSARDQRLCGYIKGATFRSCLRKINVTSYYEACLRDVCQCSANDQKCHCESFEEYVKDCRMLGINLPRWRKAVGC